ncbi:PAS domain S-box protein [Sphingosinicella rhizophila]|uniref:histidine kinase n=1 Tax=Sphingosinicella rhizophila TaxID=3050082 RepID=A0ABU3QCE9_9SPHN|nr:PAS domain S-box protein [Sphingosinicella sp. GR2756]MDT9600610.1 PAS domain S-box protein [Sphingosinicella sp. GR2756]
MMMNPAYSNSELFVGDGEMASLMRAKDWSRTSLGPVETWSQSLKVAVRILLTSRFDMWLGWGEDVAFLYNDAYRPTLGNKHPASLAQKTHLLWAEIWSEVGPLVRQVFEEGESTWSEALLLLLERNGYPEETYHTFSYSPVFDDSGRVGGLLCAVVEETDRIITGRRLDSLRILATELATAEAPQEVFAAAQTALAGNARDVPFSLIYLFEGDVAHLVGKTGFEGSHPAFSHTIDLTDAAHWPLASAGATIDLADLAELPRGPWQRPPERAVILSLQGQGGEVAHGAIVVGLNPHLLPDGAYRGYLELLAGQVTSGLASAEAYDTARRRAAALAEAARLREEAAEALREANLRLETEIEARTAERDRLRTLFQRAPGFMCILRGPDHVFEFMNEAYLQLVGHRDLAGLPARVALPEVEGQGYFDRLDEVYRTGQAFVGQNLEVDLQRAPGCPLEKRYLNLVYQPITEADGTITGIFAEGHDVTDHVRSEEALRQLNADLERQVIERTQARGLTWQVSPDLLGALNPQGYFETSNPAWQSVLGWSETEVASMSIFDLLHPDDVERTRTGFNLTQRGQPAIRFPNRYRCKDGSYRWISWVGIPEDGMVYCSGRDITEEVAAEAERDRLWALSEDLLARADYNGNLLAVNPAWTKVLGWSEQKLLTDAYVDIIHPDNHEHVIGLLDEMKRTGQPTRFENRILAASGVWTPIDWTVSPEPGGVQFIAVGRDLTEYKAREEELLVAQAALRQSQKMEAVGQLTGGLAHDFNNLLAGISGNLELLELRLGQGKTSGLDRYIGNAQDGARRAAALTQRLLAFSRRQTLDPKAIDMNALIAGMEELIRRTVGPAVHVEVVGAGGLWLTLVDPSQLENALLNLVINARDAMSDGGRITIETANKWLDTRAAKERELPPGQYVSLCVTDTGSGMAPEVIARAFDPFFTTKPLGQGTGLGLSMIHGFVRQSGGQVRIYSEVGSGTTMCLYLPRFTGEADDGAEAAGEAGTVEAGHGETIMVIDDDQAVRTLVVEVLREAGYAVIEAADGPRGIEVFKAARRVDLLITDVGLPGGLNGRQVADALRVIRPGLKVLFITGYAENAAIGNGLLEPGMEVITKPFGVAAFGAKVRDILDQ